MSIRKEISPQRPHTGDKTAKSQRGTPNDHCPTTTSSNNNNNEHSSAGLQNIQGTLEESVDTTARESATPANHLTAQDESSNRADMRTVIEVDETVCDNAPRFDAGKEHALLHDAEKFSKHGPHCTPHDTAGPSAEGLSTQREQTNHKVTISRGEPVDTGDRRHGTTSNDMSPGSAEFDRQRRHRPIETRGAIGPELVEFGRQREHTNTHDTISQELLEFSKQREHNSTRGTISTEFLGFGSQGKQTNARGTIGLESAEFGTQREHNIQHGPNTSTSVGLECNENGDSLGRHVANTLTPMEFDAHCQMNPAYAKRKTCNATEVEITATEVDSKTYNQLLSGASALTSQSVTKQDDDDDDSSANQTDEEHESSENGSSISDSSEDDPGSIAFFACRLCFSDRIRHWVLIPCGHMLCYACVENKLVCPFCGALVEYPCQFRYGYE